MLTGVTGQIGRSLRWPALCDGGTGLKTHQGIYPSHGMVEEHSW